MQTRSELRTQASIKLKKTPSALSVSVVSSLAQTLMQERELHLREAFEQAFGILVEYNEKITELYELGE
jgi:hypothetical protein